MNKSFKFPPGGDTLTGELANGAIACYMLGMFIYNIYTAFTCDISELSTALVCIVLSSFSIAAFVRYWGWIKNMYCNVWISLLLACIPISGYCAYLSITKGIVSFLLLAIGLYTINLLRKIIKHNESK